MPEPDPAAPKPRPRPSPVLIGTGILVIALGFGLPQLAPSASPASPKATTADVGNSKVAPPAPAPSHAPAPASPEFGTAIARLIGGLVVVCALCVVATRYLNRRPVEPTGTMKVLASLRVAPRCVVHLVRAGDRRMLIGTDATGVKSLLELPGATPEPIDLPVTPQAVDATSVVVGPVAVAMPQPNQNDVLTILARIQAARVGPSSPG